MCIKLTFIAYSTPILSGLHLNTINAPPSKILLDPDIAKSGRSLLLILRSENRHQLNTHSPIRRFSSFLFRVSLALSTPIYLARSISFPIYLNQYLNLSHYINLSPYISFCSIPSFSLIISFRPILNECISVHFFSSASFQPFRSIHFVSSFLFMHFCSSISSPLRLSI